MVKGDVDSLRSDSIDWIGGLLIHTLRKAPLINKFLLNSNNIHSTQVFVATLAQNYVRRH